MYVAAWPKKCDELLLVEREPILPFRCLDLPCFLILKKISFIKNNFCLQLRTQNLEKSDSLPFWGKLLPKFCVARKLCRQSFGCEFYVVGSALSWWIAIHWCCSMLEGCSILLGEEGRRDSLGTEMSVT